MYQGTVRYVEVSLFVRLINRHLFIRQSSPDGRPVYVVESINEGANGGMMNEGIDEWVE